MLSKIKTFLKNISSIRITFNENNETQKLTIFYAKKYYKF